jgi:Na+/H+-dicarboxylate symporter
MITVVTHHHLIKEEQIVQAEVVAIIPLVVFLVVVGITDVESRKIRQGVVVTTSIYCYKVLDRLGD